MKRFARENGLSLFFATIFLATLVGQSFAGQRNFNAEIGIHFPGLEGLDKPVVWVFPQLVVCFNCGFTEFVIPQRELRQLAQSDAAVA